jgi:hypothetical protein
MTTNSNDMEDPVYTGERFDELAQDMDGYRSALDRDGSPAPAGWQVDGGAEEEKDGPDGLPTGPLTPADALNIIGDALNCADNDDAHRVLLARNAMRRAGFNLDEPAPAGPNPDDLVCLRCGSDDVECTAWINVNTNEISTSDSPTDANYCNGCDIETSLVMRSEYPDAHAFHYGAIHEGGAS